MWSPRTVRCVLFMIGGFEWIFIPQKKQTSLHYACIKGHGNVARMLLDRGVDVNSKDWKVGMGTMMFSRG